MDRLKEIGRYVAGVYKLIIAFVGLAVLLLGAYCALQWVMEAYDYVNLNWFK